MAVVGLGTDIANVSKVGLVLDIPQAGVAKPINNPTTGCQMVPAVFVWYN